MLSLLRLGPSSVRWHVLAFRSFSKVPLSALDLDVPVRFFTAFGEQTFQPTGWTAVECERCGTRLLNWMAHQTAVTLMLGSRSNKSWHLPTHSEGARLRRGLRRGGGGGGRGASKGGLQRKGFKGVFRKGVSKGGFEGVLQTWASFLRSPLRSLAPSLGTPLRSPSLWTPVQPALILMHTLRYVSHDLHSTLPRCLLHPCFSCCSNCLEGFCRHVSRRISTCFGSAAHSHD